jgi:hypothetical protein
VEHGASGLELASTRRSVKQRTNKGTTISRTLLILGKADIHITAQRLWIAKSDQEALLDRPEWYGRFFMKSGYSTSQAHPYIML